MFTAILWDYDGTLANTPVKNIAVTRAVLGRLDPALLDPLPEALSSLAAYQAANYRWRNWRELYQHALRVPADRLDEAGALWGPCQLADRTLPPLFGGLLEVLPRLAALAPMGICSQNDSGNIRAALAAHGAADCFAAVVGHADVDFARQKPDPAAFLACLDRLGLREGRFAYIGDHAGDIAFGRNAQAALRAMGRAAEVVCVAAAWGGAPSVDLAAADAVAARPADRCLIPRRPPLGPGDLDAYFLHCVSFRLRGGGDQSSAPSCIPRMRTRAAISSTAPSMPVILEFRVRSYRRISPQLCPV